MGFCVDAELYDVEPDGQESESSALAEDVLMQYARYRFEEGLPMAEAAARMGVDIPAAQRMEHQVLRLGRPRPDF